MRLTLGLLISILLVSSVQAAQSPPVHRETLAAENHTFWGGWTVPVNVSQSPKAEPQATWPTLGVAEGGQVVYLAWSDDRGTVKDVHYAASADGGWNWGAAQPVATTSDDSLRPTLTVSGTAATIAWADEHADREHHTTCQMTLGAGTPSTVVNDHDVLASAPRLVWGSGDELHLALQGGVDNRTDILYTHKPATATSWPAASVVFTHTIIGSSGPALAVGADGQSLHLVWQEKESPSQSAIFYQRGQRSGGEIIWEPHLSLSEGLTLSVRPEIVTAGGSIHAVWGEQIGSGLDKFKQQYIRYRRSDDGGATWNASRRISQNPMSANNVAPTDVSPALAATPAGALCVAWHGFRTDAAQEAEEIFVSCSTDQGDSWSAPVNVSRSPEAISIRPVLAVGSDGILHLAWQEYVGPSAVSNYEIYYARSLPYSIMLPLIRR